MTQTTYPKHRFYFNVETESNGQQIANELPSYRIACQHIKHYAQETGNQQEVYYIRLFRRKNHKCWSVLQCKVKFRDDQVLITGADGTHMRQVFRACRLPKVGSHILLQLRDAQLLVVA